MFYPWMHAICYLGGLGSLIGVPSIIEGLIPTPLNSRVEAIL